MDNKPVLFFPKLLLLALFVCTVATDQGHFEAILGTFLAIFRPPGLLQVKLAFLGVGGLSGLQILLVILCEKEPETMTKYRVNRSKNYPFSADNAQNARSMRPKVWPK